MKKEKTIKKIHSLLLVGLVLAFMVGFVFFAVGRMKSYIKSSGEENMSAVMEQMEQSYDLRITNLFERLQRIEKNLFSDKTRSIALHDYQLFLDVMRDGAFEKILFIKENGQAMDIGGDERYLDIQSSSLMRLQAKEKIAQSVSWNVNAVKENYYLVALPCEPYYVDGS